MVLVDREYALRSHWASTSEVVMKFLVVIFSLAFSLAAFASTDSDDIQNCLHRWEKHPFAKANPDFRVITAKVKVMGIGGEVVDQVKTEKPELILLKPNVTVMSKSVISLLNPNGWYCVKGKVDVMGKSEIMLACSAHLAASGGATVLGSDDAETGVTVLGRSTVERVGCANEGAKEVE
jgi:hypothetical protein